MRRWLHVLVAVVGVGCCWGCQTPLGFEAPALPVQAQSDEERIAQILQDVQQGMQTKRIYRVIAHVSKNYKDDQGRDYETMRQYLDDLFEDYRTITVRRVNPRVVVQGDEAVAMDTFATRAEPADPTQTAPIDVQGDVSAYFRRENGEWKIVKWSPLH